METAQDATTEQVNTPGGQAPAPEPIVPTPVVEQQAAHNEEGGPSDSAGIRIVRTASNPPPPAEASPQEAQRPERLAPKDKAAFEALRAAPAARAEAEPRGGTSAKKK